MGEEELVSIVEHALNSPDNSDIVFLKEIAEEENTRAYHRACKYKKILNPILISHKHMIKHQR